MLCLHTRVLKHSVVYLRQPRQRVFCSADAVEHFDEAAQDSLVFLPMASDPGGARLERVMHERALEYLESQGLLGTAVRTPYEHVMPPPGWEASKECVGMLVMRVHHENQAPRDISTVPGCTPRVPKRTWRPQKSTHPQEGTHRQSAPLMSCGRATAAIVDGRKRETCSGACGKQQNAAGHHPSRQDPCGDETRRNA